MLAECARILLRRWRWVAVALVLALIAGAAGYKIVGPSQQSRAEVLFVPSAKQPGVTGATNPFRLLDSSLSAVASIVQVSVMDDKTMSKLIQAGDHAGYKVEPNLAQNAGPTLLVTVEDKAAAMVDRTLKAVLTQIQVTLRDLQAARNVPQDQYIDAVVLVQSPHPAPSRKAPIQAGVIAVVAVAFLSVLLILLGERRLHRRRQPAPAHNRPREDWRAPRNGGQAAPAPTQPAIEPKPRVRRRTKAPSPTTNGGGTATTGRDDEATSDMLISADLSDTALL